MLVLIDPAFLATHYSPLYLLLDDNETSVQHGEFSEAKKHADRTREKCYRYVPASHDCLPRQRV